MIFFLAVGEVVLWLGVPLIAFLWDRRSRRKAVLLQKALSQSSELPPPPDPHRRAHETLSLAALLHLANSRYPDGWLSEYFDPATGERTAGSGDTLAQFIVIEISETFVPDAPTIEQLEAARRVLLRAVDDLHHVIQAFDTYEQQPH